MVHLGVKKSSSTTEVDHGPPPNFRNFVLEGHGPYGIAPQPDSSWPSPAYIKTQLVKLYKTYKTRPN
jgi:hypothetical protein